MTTMLQTLPLMGDLKECWMRKALQESDDNSEDQEEKIYTLRKVFTPQSDEKEDADDKACEDVVE